MDTQRLILFFVFSFSLLLLWEAWQKEHRPVVPAVPTSPLSAPAPGAPVAAPGASVVPAVNAPQGGQRVRVRTDTVVAEIDTQGGDLVYLELLQHKDTLDGSKNLVLLGPEHHYAAQSGLTGGLPFHRTLFTTAELESTLAPGKDSLQVRLEASTPDGVKVTKILTFHRGSYQIDITEEIRNGTASPVSTFAYFQLTRDGKAPPGDPRMAQTYTGAALYTEQDKFQKVPFSDIDKGKLPSKKSSDGWIAIIQHYFVAALLPTDKVQRDFYASRLADDLYSVGVKIPVTPRLMKLREQYADDKAKLNQAMMDMYKTEKINPLGGCLPILVQIPVFIALYWVLFESVELRNAPFYLWIKDLSAPDPWYVLPTLMMASMIVQTKMNPTPPDPGQAKVMMIMPFAFGVMFYFFPSGLVLYWFVNNILSILQQWQITRMIEGEKAAASARR